MCHIDANGLAMCRRFDSCRFSFKELQLKSKKKSKSGHAFIVVYSQFDEVTIRKVRIKRSDENTVTYVTEAGTEFTTTKVGPSFRWFKSEERALKFAHSKVRQRITFYTALVKKLKLQATSLEVSK